MWPGMAWVAHRPGVVCHPRAFVLCLARASSRRLPNGMIAFAEESEGQMGSEAGGALRQT